MPDTPTLRWGIVSTGNIAHAFASDLADARHGKLVAVGSRSQASADAFAAEYDGIRAHGSYEALFGDEDVDAVYVATPHPSHAELSIAAARAGKHVLCEKPLAVNAADAEAVIEAAKSAGVTLMEAFMYRCHPQTKKLYELIRDGAIGELQLIRASFAFRAGPNPEGRLMNNDTAGGGILDVGCYCVSIARLLAGAARGQPSAEPETVTGVAHLGETGVDEWALATLDFGGGVLAELCTGVRMNDTGPQLTLIGTEGRITAVSAFIPGRKGGEVSFMLKHGDDEKTITTVDDRPLYAIEADTFAQAVAAGDVPHPAHGPAEALANMKVLDRWRDAVGLTYRTETTEGYRKTTVAGDSVRAGDRIPHASLGDLPGGVSRLVMGCDNRSQLRDVVPLFDAFWEAGGNTFDTAHIYGAGRSKALGAWLDVRDLGASAHVICKGGHTPYCYPSTLRFQLEQQLDWLGLEACSLYFMHRDNTDVPVGEFVDVLDELADAGLIRGPFGGSNWTLERTQAANAYAEANGRRGFGAMSQNLSLAVMVDPVWAGCVTAHDDDWLAWLEKTGTANFAWSSQARGFFVPGRDLDEPDLKRCWVSEENLERRRRAVELAEELGVEPINIAAAWVLQQPFPSFALIGPRTLGELESSLHALSITLTPEKMRWLDLKD